jgi:hypothetical protein
VFIPAIYDQGIELDDSELENEIRSILVKYGIEEAIDVSTQVFILAIYDILFILISKIYCCIYT